MVRCKICGADTKQMKHPKLGDIYYFCDTCEFIAKDRRFYISKEKELKIYNNHHNSIEDPTYVAYFNKFLKDAVFKYMDIGKKGFDFGSGPHPVLAELLARDYGYSMDIYDKFYAPAEVYKNKKYDLVISTEVVEHLEDPIYYFLLFKELLCEKGILSIMTLFHKCEEEHFWKWNYIRDRSHISFYTPKTMEYIAKIVGLKIVYTNNIRYMTFCIDT